MRRVAGVIAAMLLLNGLLSMTNLWPTPLVVPDRRIAPEFVIGWCGLLAWVAVRGVPGPRLLTGLAVVTLLLVVGRYIDVTVPALFGRTINLYWDGQQVPRFVSVIAQRWSPAAATGVVLLALVVAAVGLRFAVRGLRVAWRTLAVDAAPWVLRRPPAIAATLAALALTVANFAGVQATWPWVSRPVVPTYARQAVLLTAALSPARLAAALPPSPSFDGGLAALRGADVTVIFLESYGAVTFDDPALRERLAAPRDELLRSVGASGRQVVSAYFGSPTFGGASDLAHLGLLSGIDLKDPLRHDLLLTSDRPTLVGHFRRHGWRTFGLYPALSWDWPERRYYGFDVFLDGRDLGWTGPKLGYWWIPDQFTIARFEALFPRAADPAPRLLFFPTITSHAPFRPVPPYQPDWQRVLGAEPYDPDAVRAALDQRIDWLDMRPGYAGMMVYTHQWLAGWLARPRERRELVVMLGDHQPTSGITGPGARWDVPVHVVSDDPAVLGMLRAAGFVDGLLPAARPLGGLHELTAVLLAVFDGMVPTSAARRSPAAGG